MNRNQKAELMIRTWRVTSFPTCPPAHWIISFMDDGLGSTLCVTYTMISCRNWRRILICLSTHYTWDISGFTNFQSCQNWNWIGFFFLRSVIGFEDSRHTPKKTKPPKTWTFALRCSLGWLREFTLSSHWLLDISTIEPIGRCDLYNKSHKTQSKSTLKQ